MNGFYIIYSAILHVKVQTYVFFKSLNRAIKTLTYQCIYIYNICEIGLVG